MYADASGSSHSRKMQCGAVALESKHLMPNGFAYVQAYVNESGTSLWRYIQSEWLLLSSRGSHRTSSDIFWYWVMAPKTDTAAGLPSSCLGRRMKYGGGLANYSMAVLYAVCRTAVCGYTCRMRAGPCRACNTNVTDTDMECRAHCRSHRYMQAKRCTSALSQCHSGGNIAISSVSIVCMVSSM